MYKKVLSVKRLMESISLVFILISHPIFSQTQIGSDIDGEAIGDQSGVVSLSGNGNLVAIGAAKNDGNGVDAGHVRVYQKKFIAGSWVKLRWDIDGEAAGDKSGKSVSLNYNGKVLAVGAPGNGTGLTGHVRVYTLPMRGAWTQVGNDIDGKGVGDQFGYAVSLNDDGDIVAIGAVSNDNGEYKGYVQVYQNVSGSWTQLGSDIMGEDYADRSGYSVSLSDDGNVVAIGAIDNTDGGSRAGHVRIYQYSGGTWVQIGSDIDGGVDDWSGWSVSMNDDGSVVAIGAVQNYGSNAGYVSIYQDIAGVWTQIGSDIIGEATNDGAGSSVSLSNDGSIVAIGAMSNDGNGNASGHVRAYQNIAGVWTQLVDDIDGEATGDMSGTYVSLSANGSKVAIGAHLNDGNGNSSGHVRVYRLFTPSGARLSTQQNEEDMHEADIKENTLSIYPNPTSDVIRLQENAAYTIFDINGKLYLEGNTLDKIIDVSQLAEGIYVIHSGSKSVTFKKNR